MVCVPTAVEVDGELGCDLGGDIVGVDGFLHFFFCSVEVGHVSFVVPVVMEFHNLAADCRFEGAIVILLWLLVSEICLDGVQYVCLHGRSGNVALPRVKVVLAGAARFAIVGPEARSAVCKAAFLRSVDAILIQLTDCNKIFRGRDG